MNIAGEKFNVVAYGTGGTFEVTQGQIGELIASAYNKGYKDGLHAERMNEFKRVEEKRERRQRKKDDLISRSSPSIADLEV